MYKKSALFLFSGLAFIACNGGFEKFAPPANSISGRGAKVNPKILTTTPSAGSTVSPITGSNGTQIKVVFDMSMKTDMIPVFNTWVRDIGTGNQIIWYAVANSGLTFTWSSTNFANDTVTIQLGWVRWPENNIIGFDFDNSTLVNLDDMPLVNEDKISFTVGWNPGRYKVVHTGQYACYFYKTNPAPQAGWKESEQCLDNTTGGDATVVIGSQNYPAGQNGFSDPKNNVYGALAYGAASSGIANGRRFPKPENPLNIVVANCQGNSTDACYPYSVDAQTTLLWKTCSQGQYYADGAYVLVGERCTPSAGSDFTWGQAVNACSTLNTTNNGQGYAGRKDWRLPTIEELENLVDYGVRNQTSGTEGEPSGLAPEAPAIDGYQQTAWPAWEGAFPVTPPKGYWTATGLSAQLSGTTYYGDAYVVEFKKGGMGAGGGSGALLESNRKTANRKKVRCVAGPSVAPQPQTLAPVTPLPGLGAALGGTAAAFVGYDNSNTTFIVKSATPAYDIETNTHSLTVEFNKPPNVTSLPTATQAGTTANYCIGASSATACGALIPISTALQVPGSTTAFKLTFGAAMVANTAYKLFVSNVQSASDQWQTGTAYTANTYLTDSGNAYRVVNNHTSSATIGTDVGNGDIELLAQFTAATLYTLNTKLYVPSLNVIVNVQMGYTSSSSAQTDINNTLLQVVKNVITAPPQPLSLGRAFFNGTPRTATPTATTVFNVASATSPNLTSVQVTFNRLPNATQAVALGNYCIISATANPWNCTTPLATINGATLSGHTVTLTTAANLTSGSVGYAVLVSGVTFLGSQVVDDTTNKLRWQRCRKGVFENATCGDDGDSTNDGIFWNDALNYCDNLNAIRYDSDANTSAAYRYRWRAPTINELKSIANRTLFGTQGIAIDTTIFPTPNVYAEDFASSTNYTLNGDPNGLSAPSYNLAWGFNYIAGFPSLAQKDYSTLIAGLKPPKKNIRCVRSLP